MIMLKVICPVEFPIPSYQDYIDDQLWSDVHSGDSDKVGWRDPALKVCHKKLSFVELETCRWALTLKSYYFLSLAYF